MNKELDSLKINSDVASSNMSILQKALFKQNGDTFSRKELEVLPLGVVNTIATKILKVSGVDINEQKRLGNF